MQSIESIDFKILTALSAEQAHKYRVIPCNLENGRLDCYAAIPAQVNTREIEFLLGKKISLHPADPDLFERQLARYYPFNLKGSQRKKAEIREESDVVRFVRRFMDDAVAINASDIHLERYESYARIRYRWEGQLIEKYEVPLALYNAIVSRIKILSELDISERRLPQDGRIHLKSGGQKIDVRVSTIPAKFGEKVVMRLLTRSEGFLQLENLGMHSDELTRFQTSLNYPNGIILITGPTGSGKTTTLYAALSQLNKSDVNINTIEDPVEYNVEGINQVQVKEEIGLSFGFALRAFMRQDPNIIMVGEIRDRETAEIAIRAALTGHLVFSTLHTNSAWGAVTRLIDMGVEPYLLASTLRLVVAQRLLRQLCPDCKKVSEEAVPPHLSEQFDLSQHHEAIGCPSCHFTGYSRRKAIYEVIPMDKELSQKVKSVDLEVDQYLIDHNINSLQSHVARLIQIGETSLEEGTMYLL